MIYVSCSITAHGAKGNVWAESGNSLKPQVSKYKSAIMINVTKWRTVLHNFDSLEMKLKVFPLGHYKP